MSDQFSFSELQLTKTEENHVNADDDILAIFWSASPTTAVAHRFLHSDGREELSNSAEDHEHTNSKVDYATARHQYNLQCSLMFSFAYKMSEKSIVKSVSGRKMIYRRLSFLKVRDQFFCRVNGKMKYKTKVYVCGRSQLLSRGLDGRYPWRSPGGGAWAVRRHSSGLAFTRINTRSPLVRITLI